MMTFMILNPIALISPDIKALGAIKTEVAQIPMAQTKEISCDDFLWTMRTISGISHKGKAIAAHKPIVFKGVLLCQGKEFNQHLHAFLDLAQR